MEAVEIARELIVKLENISGFKVNFRRLDSSAYEYVTSVFSPVMTTRPGGIETPMEIRDWRST